MWCTVRMALASKCSVIALDSDIALEKRTDCLRSIIAQLLYKYEILKLEGEGRNFRIYAYIPEIDQTTGLPFHEREDHNHVLKVMS